MKKRHVIGLSAVAWGCMLSSLAHADAVAGVSDNNAGGTLEEVIVTAERRSADVEKTGLSISVVSGDTIEQRGDADIAHVLEDVPGVTLQGLSASSVGGSGGPPLIDLRGVGTDGPNKSSATAVYEDGVLVEGGGADFYDISRVEVLRGPQGTLYGRGATGGAVNIITNDPTQTFGGYGQLTIGSYALVGTQGVLNMPLSSDLAARVSFNTIKRNGFFNSGESGDGETNARVKLLYQPNEDFSLLLGGVYYTVDETDEGQVPLTADDAQPAGWTTTAPAAGRDNVRYKEGYARLNWNLGFGTLTYIPSYQATNSTNSSYFSAPQLEFNLMPYNNTFTQELRLANPADSPITWIAGLYYFNQHFFQGLVGDVPGTTGVGSYTSAFSVSQVYANSSSAAFGEVTYPINAALRLTGGVRESRDTVYHSDMFSFQGPDFFSQTYEHFDWKARLEGDLSAASLLYGMVSTGYRPGGGVNGQGYAPEILTAYEIGSKNRVGDRLTLNGAAFYYHYSGFQAPQSYNFPEVITTVVSVPATIYGAEFESVALLSPADKLTLSATYLKSEFTGNFVWTNELTGQTSAEILDGGVIPHSPKWSVSADLSHTFTFAGGATLVPQADAHYQTQQFTDFDVSDYDTPPNPVYLQKAYVISNASVTFSPQGGRYRITAYGKNLNNVIYKTSIPSPGVDAAFVNDPRTYGVIISADF